MCTGHFVGFVMWRLILKSTSNLECPSMEAFRTPMAVTATSTEITAVRGG